MPGTLNSLVLAAAAVFQFPHVIEHDGVTLELFPRSPDQIAAFYEARGFPESMIDLLRRQCFITVRIHNRRDELLWLELANWTLTRSGTEIRREHRDAWKLRWQQMGIPLHNQSTFRWTLLPEVLDYLPDERESGNLIIPRVDGKLRLQATFMTGDDKRGEPVVFDYDRFGCATD